MTLSLELKSLCLSLCPLTAFLYPFDLFLFLFPYLTVAVQPGIECDSIKGAMCFQNELAVIKNKRKKLTSVSNENSKICVENLEKNNT